MLVVNLLLLCSRSRNIRNIWIRAQPGLERPAFPSLPPLQNPFQFLVGACGVVAVFVLGFHASGTLCAVCLFQRGNLCFEVGDFSGEVGGVFLLFGVALFLRLLRVFLLFGLFRLCGVFLLYGVLGRGLGFFILFVFLV